MTLTGCVPLAAGIPEAFDETALVLGLLLMGGALLTGLRRRSFLAGAPVFVLAGVALGEGGAEVLTFGSDSGFVAAVATVALIVLLFRDGLEVEAELLQRHWHLPARKLLIGMPVTAGVVTLAGRFLVGLDWDEAFLLGALLSPTDPVLSSGVVTNPRVPRVIRHSLNLESGLNDGLALAPVLALIAVLEGDDFTWWRFVLQDVGVGTATGLLLGFAAAAALPRADRIPEHQRSLYAVGSAFAIYGATVLPPQGNGLIAVYVGAMVIGIRRDDLRHAFVERSDDIVEICKLGVFVAFGTLLVPQDLVQDGLAAVLLVPITLLVARPIAVAMSLAGTDTTPAERAFIAWFGPRGVATMAFSILVVTSAVPDADRLFNLAALVVLASVIAHSATDDAGVRWLSRRTGARPRPSAG